MTAISSSRAPAAVMAEALATRRPSSEAGTRSPVSTDDRSPWADHLTRAGAPVTVGAGMDPGFSGTLRTRLLGDIRVSDIAATPHGAMRSAPGDPGGSRRRAVLIYVLEGRVVVHHDDADGSVAHGAFAYIGPAAHFAISAEESYRALVLQLPPGAIPVPREVLRDEVVIGFTPATGLGEAVEVFFSRLASELDRLQGWSGERVAHSAVELAGVALTEHAEAAAREPRPSPDFEKASEFARGHLADPQLNADSIARAIYASTRQLHKIFAAEGTSVSRWIKEQRLEQCRLMLTDPEWDWMSIGDIAASWGIFDRTQFSRIYRLAYGVSPREHRMMRA